MTLHFVLELAETFDQLIHNNSNINTYSNYIL